MKYMCVGFISRKRYDIIKRYDGIRKLDNVYIPTDKLFDMLENLNPIILPGYGGRGAEKEKIRVKERA